ncbi:Gfo/Idh/MocA family protein [Streptodolium elevatio]|uniref:Gfo/Idh/MocA family oxidoreductase n=1 Tax=Streptodolium elevatio TaxID=3157996 RepID=A0ABV3DNQ0_9ACTN
MTATDETADTFGWGIAATGSIAETVGRVIAAEPGMRIAAVGSRSKDRAAEFAAKVAGGTAYGSYADMIADPAVDAVYVATPHAQHRAIVEAAIAARKPVLCEKPLGVTFAEAEALVAQARAADVFLMEAMWMRFNPLIQRVQATVESGALGEVRSVSASLGFPVPYVPQHRLWNPALGGGALLDLGIYPVALAYLLLGSPDSMAAVGALGPSGVDAETALLLGWNGGARAMLETSLVGMLPMTATVVGTKGRIDIAPAFQETTHISVYTYGADFRPAVPEEFRIDSSSEAYAAQAREVRDCVRAGRVESRIMPLDATLGVLRILEDARSSLG